MKRWAGPLITILILAGVALILVMNLELGPATTSGQSHAVLRPASAPASATNSSPKATAKPKNFREYPIGDEVERNGLRMAAVWLPSIEMDGAGLPGAGSDLIHIEADVKAGEDNPNGFALNEFVPYLKIAYEIKSANGGPPVQSGELMPMVAADGLHYGASVAMPKAGDYRLTYTIEPPSANGLGRHTDPVTGVAPWWKPFQVGFDWDYPGPSGTSSQVQ